MDSPIVIIVALIGIYILGLIYYTYRQITKDRFYEQRDARRRARHFKTAGRFVPKKDGSEHAEK